MPRTSGKQEGTKRDPVRPAAFCSAVGSIASAISAALLLLIAYKANEIAQDAADQAERSSEMHKDFIRRLNKPWLSSEIDFDESRSAFVFRALNSGTGMAVVTGFEVFVDGAAVLTSETGSWTNVYDLLGIAEAIRQDGLEEPKGMILRKDYGIAANRSVEVLTVAGFGGLLEMERQEILSALYRLRIEIAYASLLDTDASPQQLSIAMRRPR